jgi:hypothetical protein
MTGAPATERQRSPRPELLPPGTLTHPLWLSAVTTAVLAAWILVDRGGWAYYTTPLRIRAYQAAHASLRPSGTLAHWLGVSGWLMLLVPVLYAGRKRIPILRQAGSLRTWLEVHIFCGLVGPVLVTFHTSFKFNGLISVAYWSMVIVALSGIVGRYLYVRIPKTIRGVELTYDEVVARSRSLRAELDDEALPAGVRTTIASFEQRAGGRSGLRRAWLRRRMLGRLLAQGVEAQLARELSSSAVERLALESRLAGLERTKRFFGLWHVFHLPLVWLMFGIVTLHIGLALYLGYWPRLSW